MQKFVKLKGWFFFFERKMPLIQARISLSKITCLDSCFLILLTMRSKQGLCFKNMSIAFVEQKSASVFNLALTWNDWYCFQSSENSECSQRWDIAQVHKLCHISVIGEFTHKHNDNTQITVGDMRGLTPYTNYFLPGITEIVFKALNTLKVRRAETLPRLTNSVIYL